MKKLLASGIGALSTLAFPLAAFASPIMADPCSADPKPDFCISPGIGPVVGFVIQFIFVIAVLLALGFLVYGGIKWITSGGDKSNVETARGTIIAAIIGLIIVFLAYVILNLVLQFLTGGGIGDIEIPSLV